VNSPQLPPAGRWSQSRGAQIFDWSESGSLSSEPQKLPGLLRVRIESAGAAGTRASAVLSIAGLALITKSKR
jgi:hypothetical protein